MIHVINRWLMVDMMVGEWLIWLIDGHLMVNMMLMDGQYDG